MPSLIAWLDSTPEEQKAARELIAMFSDKESRDELGIGPIRDAFSDLLFPGTSVLQTRARYYLFIPWCYQTQDVLRLSGKARRRKGRDNERTLIKTLRSSGETDKAGLIGARAGVNVQKLPSELYWSGMLRYGIREHRGGIGSLQLPAGPDEEATELTERSMAEWSRTVPPVPSGFPHLVESAFSLAQEEAAWLKEQIVKAANGTVLAHLLEREDPIPKDSPAPWFTVPEKHFDELHHARLFSDTMRGAALLYNLLIAERHQRAGLTREGEDLVADYRDQLRDWHTNLLDVSGAALASWDLREMWEITKAANPNIQPRAEAFVNRWVSGLKSTTKVDEDQTLQHLVAEREKRKGAQSRLKNEKMLAAWTGASGTARLTYRWGTIRTIVNDIIRGLDGAGS